MAGKGATFEQWLREAEVLPERLTDQQRSVLNAVFQFLRQAPGDYSTSRIASHFLLHCSVGLKITQIARLVGINARSAFRHRNLSAKQVGQQIHHHFQGRPYGKLLPRHAGSIAEFLFKQPEATRDELLDFIAQAWGFRVSKVALWKFLNKYGLDGAALHAARQAAAEEQKQGTAQALEGRPAGALVPVPPDNFFWPHPVRRGLFAVAPGALLAGNGPRLFHRRLLLP